MHQPIPRRALPFAGALLALAIVAGGCGSDDETTTTAEATPSASTTAAAIDQRLLDRAMTDYDDYVESETAAFVDATEGFLKPVEVGDIAAAKAAYPAARVHFERIEPVAGAFGDLDPDIDGREGDIPPAEWGGYHRIEKALWVEKTTEGLDVTIKELRNDVANLNDIAIKADFDPVDIAQGSVDLMAEVSSSKITGEEERYSHTDLWDFEANVEGAEVGFKALEPALGQVDPELVRQIKEQVAQMHKLLNRYRKGDGFVLYHTLSPKQTQELSQQVDALAESLSKVPAEVG